MTKYKIEITASSALDPIPRQIGLAIDKELPPNFAELQPETVIGGGYKSFSRTVEVDIPEGEHILNVAVNAPEVTPWTVEVFALGLVSGTHITHEDSPWTLGVTVPEIPPEVVPEVVPDEIPEIVPEVPVIPTALEEAIRAAEEAEAAIEAAELPTPPTAVSLPWYMSWLQPVLDYGGQLTQAVVNFFAPIFAPLGDIGEALFNFTDTLLSGLVAGLRDIWNTLIGASRDNVISSVKGLSEGSPEWEAELHEGLVPIEQQIITGYQEALDLKTYEKSPLTGVQAIAALEDMRNRLLATALFNFSMHAAAEATSFGQFEAIAQIDPMVTSKFGLDAVVQAVTMKPIEKALLIPAEQELNKRYVPLIPPYSDLINMRVKEVIDEKEFIEAIARTGYSSVWAGRIWDAHFYPPSYEQLLSAHYRGVIPLDELKVLRTIVDLDPRFSVIWDGLIEEIPPYSELVNERVKEVIDQATFEKYMAWYGFGPEWAGRVWDAHFYPPSLGDLLTAWRRGLIDEDRLDQLMILVDLDPRFKKIFDTRKYVDPSLRTARYMYELGAINEGRVAEIVHRQGYTPEDSEAVTEYLTKFQERMWRQRYLYALESGYTIGAIPEDELTKAVLEAGYSKEVAGWMIQTAEVKTRIAAYKVEAPRPKALTTSDLKKAYILDKITADVLRTELLTRGYDVGEVDILIDLIDHDKMVSVEGRRVVTLSISQLLNAYRYKEMTRDEILTKLQLRGLAVDEAETLVKTKEKQWGVSA